MLAMLIRHRRQKLIFLAAAMATFAALCWCCTEDRPIRIGFTGPLQGNYSDFGVQARNGAQLATETLNEKGGVAGRWLELVVRDDNGTVAGALKADRELMQQDVVAIVGHILSVQSLAAVKEFADEPLILLSPTTSTPLLSGKKDNFFRVMPPHKDWAAALADYVAEHLGKPATLLLLDDDNKSYVTTFCEAFATRYAQLGGDATMELHFSSSSPGWEEEVLARVAADKPQALLAAASARDTASLVRRLRLARESLQILVTPWAYTKSLVAQGGSAVEGVISSMCFDENSQTPEFLAFKNAYRKRFGREPDFAAAFAYDAVLALADALSRTGGTAEGLAAELVKVRTLQGAMGPFTIDENGDVKRRYFIVAVRDGKLQTLSQVAE